MAVKKIRSPESLEEPERDIWKRILLKYQVDDEPALRILQSSLEAHQRMRQCREVIDHEGMQQLDRFGQAKAHPLLCVERDARSAFLAGFRHLGFEETTVEQPRPGRPAKVIR